MKTDKTEDVRFVARFAPDLYKILVDEAKTQRRSTNLMVVYIIEEYFRNKKLPVTLDIHSVRHEQRAGQVAVKTEEKS